ncbi:MAG: zinc-binding alcohol dehydrogenase family protein [Gammaproteobacteria bacterium]
MITTEAWVLAEGPLRDPSPGTLRLEEVSFPDPSDEEVLVEPIYGCWETNMSHAMRRKPVDICRLRREKKIVLGNSGAFRVTRVGRAVTAVKEGDRACVVPVGQLDSYGYIERVFAYDAPHTIGMLARQTKLHQTQIWRIPDDTKYTLAQWAAFSVRYATAWDNWKVAYGCFRTQLSEQECPAPFVCGWGGGVSLAELSLALRFGCRAAMIASTDERLALIRSLGITPIDRRPFMDLDFNAARYASDHEYKVRYLNAERKLLAAIKDLTQGQGVNIFIDNIGTPVLRATLSALSRQGVITTTGWDQGDTIGFSRISECINRHVHVNTHGCRFSEGKVAPSFGEAEGWMPPDQTAFYSWAQVPDLASDFVDGKISSYFPVYEVNPA